VMLLEGRVVWITGASRGIGREVALYCAKLGASLALAARTEDNLAATHEALAALGAKSLLLGYDVADATQTKEAAKRISQHFGALHGMVNNAGVLKDALLGMLRPEDGQSVLGVNLVGTLNHLQWSSRLMKGAGSIVNVSSIVGRTGNVGQTVYAASKAGVIGATLAAAKELAPRGIRVNAVTPGYIDTDMIKHLPDTTHQARLASIGMGRIGTPRDVANVVGFLLSDLAGYVTGQVIGVDGGMVL
jgi:3-oxoacyl-[acyl-carrier protein] reductase